MTKHENYQMLQPPEPRRRYEFPLHCTLALGGALAGDWPMVEACRYGVAAAATVTTEATELTHRQDVEEVYRRLTEAADQGD